MDAGGDMDDINCDFEHSLEPNKEPGYTFVLNVA